MGDFRFTYGAVKGIISGKSYPCELAVKIVEDNIDVIKQRYRDARDDIQDKSSHFQPDEYIEDRLIVDAFGSIKNPVPDDWTIFTQDIIMCFGGKLPWVAKDCLFFPCALPGDGYIDLMVVFKS